MRYLLFAALSLFLCASADGQTFPDKTTLPQKTYAACSARYEEGLRLQSSGNLEEAREQFAQASTLALEILPMDAPEVNQCLHTLIPLLQPEGEVAEQKGWEEIMRKHDLLRKTGEEAGNLLQQMENSSLDAIEQAYERYRTQFRSEKVFEALARPGQFHWTEGNRLATLLADASALIPDDAAIIKLTYLQTALSVVENAVPLQRPLYLQALAKQYHQLGMEEEAIKLATEALPGAVRTYGQASLTVWELCSLLTSLHLDREEFQQALPFAEQKLETGRQLYVNYQFHHNYALDSYDQLTAVLEGLNNLPEAEKQYRKAAEVMNNLPEGERHGYYAALIAAGLKRCSLQAGTYAGRNIPLEGHEAVLQQLLQPLRSEPDPYDGTTYLAPLPNMQQAAALWRLGQEKSARQLFSRLDFDFDQNEMKLWSMTMRLGYSSWDSNPGTFPALRQLRRLSQRLGSATQRRDISFIFSHCFTDFILCHQHLLQPEDLEVLLGQAQSDNRFLFIEMAQNPAHFYDFGRIQNLLNDIILRNSETGPFRMQPLYVYQEEALGAYVLAALEQQAEQFELLNLLFSFSADDLNRDALYDGLSDILEQEAQYNYIQPEELIINFIRFHYNGKDASPTDEVRYYALIRRSEDSIPNPEPIWGFPEDEDFRFIPLFKEEALQQLVDQGSAVSESVAGLFGQSRGVISSNAPSGPDPTALYELLWAPLEKEMAQLGSFKRIYYVKSGLLNRIPLAPISLPEGGRLIDRYELFPLSTGGFSRGNLGGLNITNWSMQAFGGIDYERTASAPEDAAEIAENQLAQAAIRANRGNKWAYLPGTLEEIELLEQRMRTKVQSFVSLSKENATEEAFKEIGKQKASPAILHVATHGFFFPRQEGNNSSGNDIEDANDPLLRTGLLLAGANLAWGNTPLPGREDGILTAREIADLNLANTELAVLSACETGLGQVNAISEEVFGLQRAFKMAGVRFQIMSLWKVPDSETVEFMDLFYGHLAAGQDIRKAFNLTQREMSRRYEPEKWAAFVLLD